ncbi:hypothetical protein AVEN_267892-1 [Araneus ventricosus]|uniref:G domain-containing protein n=1 Tax=Araneus ventricosus TaxID=182803 RepID=A0A4Y2VCB4_ARAVE|nr:hypothetical protein AVEN_267892-1 [Araneus ventricosus]
MATSLISRPGRGLDLPNAKVVFAQDADNEKGDNVVKETFDFLEKGEKEIKLDEMYKDVIMILGITGSGKSTFTQWVAGDNTKLISKQTGEGTGEYIIEGPGISNSTIKSETIFPELVIDAKTNTAYYDCPGFSDTQGTSHEIAETYFIKKVLDFLENLKMVFTINHSSVRKGVDRQDFMKLLRHVTDLVKDIDKFKDSIAMVATKVDNQYRKQGNDIVLVGDDIVIAAIAGFLQEAKQYLEDNSKRPNVSEKENRFYENAIKFVEVLLEKEEEKYTRIGIFRRPDMPGPVSDIPLLREGKQYIEKIVYEKLNFSAKNNEDFGYTVSERTKNDINEIVEEINKNLWSRLSNISEKILGYCENLVEQVRDKLRLFVNEVNVVDANPSEAKAFRYKFISAYNSTSELVNKTTNLTNPEELAVIVNTTTSNLNIEIPEDDILYIATQGNYFNFLQRVSDKLLSSRPWYQSFKEVETFLSASKTIILQDVDSAAKYINDRIQINLNNTIKVIHEEYTEKIKSLEIQKLPDKLNRDFRIIFELTEEIKNEITTEKLVNATRYVSDNLKISLPEENLQIIANQGKYLKFLEILSDETLNVYPMMWLSPFENLAKYFHESEKWYTFLEDLYNKFSEYDIQKNRQKYNVADLEDWGQPGKPQGISVTSNTFKDFVNKIGNLNVAEYETIKNMTSTTDLQIEELNQALSLTLKHRPTVRCLETLVIAKGSFILLDETMQNLISNSDTNNSCQNFKDDFPDGKYKLLKMFALNNVFIDTDLSFAGKGISVAVIAPKWEVLESRNIELHGVDGAPKEEPKAKNGVHPGNDGFIGVPGNPGGSGESFFGIGSAFTNGANLKITANGGKGGVGQEGGDGATGLHGQNAPKPSTDDPPCENGYFRDFKCETLKERTEEGFGRINWITTFRVIGLPGRRGGNGGNGGKGGKGSYSGKIEILELNQSSEITKLTSNGTEGEVGKAGAGGQGGKRGDDVEGDWSHILIYYPHCEVGCTTKRWDWAAIRVNNDRALTGSNGASGENADGIKDPVPANGISGLPNLINEYKMYLRENINNRFTKFSLLQFLEELNSSNDVRNLYDILALIDEFQGLEEQFHKLSKQIDFSLFYNSLLDRICEFAKNLKEGPNSSENKKVLNYLYTATLGRIRNLRDSSETSLIIDIRKYLNLIKENIKTLKDLETQNNKVEVINKYKENYKKGIDKKIEEAMFFIKNQVSPEIENINAKIDDQVNTLIAETIALQEEAETEIEKLAEQKKKLGKTLALKGLFGCFQIIGGIVKLLGPIGIISGAVIDAASAVGNALALDDRKKALNLPSDVASAIKDIVDQIKSMRNKKVAYLQKLLDDLSEEIKKNPEKLSDMEGKINDIKDKLKKVSENKLDYKQFKTLEDDLNKELKRKGDDLKSNPNDNKSAKALKVIEKIAKIVEFGSLLLSVYDKIKEEKDKMGVVNDAMKKLEDQLKKLREYEEYIYDTIVPMLNEMMAHMKDISEKLGTKSQVALDVTKWQVQSNLKDIRMQMQRLTEGFKVKDDLNRSIEKLDEVMTTLIIIYDRIQSYQDQKKLADYIGDISSVAANGIHIKNQQLANAVNHLEYVIRANIVLEQYKSAIDALKQWVFPFADHYIEKSMLPSQIELETNIEDLVQNAARQIEAIKQKIDLYDASVKNGDEYLQCEEFSSRYVSSQPFFVWKNEDFGSLISNLLSGKQVVLKADVKYSAPYKHAIKFSEIDFYFKIKNDTAQSLLSQILKGFDIRATHLGNSYYRYADKIFLITSDSVTISYSYEKNDDGIPIRSNKVYNTLKSGDLLLSPYTLWEARIINKTNQYSFEDLENFKNETNLELSGFGSYVDTNVFRVPTNMSEARGMNECRRSKYRLARSVNEVVVDGDYITNDAPKGISSPINFICNFLKTYFISNAITSINHIFVGEQRSQRICDDCSDFPNERTEMRNIGPIVESNLTIITSTVKVDASSAGNGCIKEIIEPKSDIIFHVNFNGNNSCSKSFLLDNQNYRSNNHSTQVPDLNCSLLLADLVTRTITGNRYKSPVDECLLSPPEVILGKISVGAVRSESDTKQMLQRLLSEKEERPSSWFSKLNGYAKSMFHYLGLVRNENTEGYVQDIHHLFA